MVAAAGGQITGREAEEGLSDLGAANEGLGCGLGAGRVQLYGEGNAASLEDESLQREGFVNGREGNLGNDAGGYGRGCRWVLWGGGGGGEEGKEGGEQKGCVGMHVAFSFLFACLVWKSLESRWNWLNVWNGMKRKKKVVSVAG